MNFSIAIPSFNRSRELINQISNINSLALHSLQEILVINNGYDQLQISDSLYKVSDKYRVRVVDVSDQPGFHFAFISLVKAVNTEYFLYVTDDDVLSAEYLHYIDSLSGLNHACILSPQWIGSLGHFIRRNNAGKVLKRSSDILAATAHAPGLVFNTRSAQSSLPKLSNLVNQDFEIVKVYPQVFLSVYMTSESSYLTLTSRIAGRDSCGNNSDITVNGYPYFHTSSRFIQLASLSNVLSNAQQFELPIKFLLILYGRLLGKIILEVPVYVVIIAFYSVAKKLFTSFFAILYSKLGLKRLIDHTNST